MTPLPKPLSQRPTGMPQQRRKSSLRTAAGTTQEAFLARLRELREDPTVVLPQVDGDGPKPLRSLASKLERMKERGPGFLDRFDKGIVGAVAHTCRIADQESVPRLLDAKIAGQRRFYLHRGHVDRAAMIGVQNFDEPRVLLVAYTLMAQKHGLHFFATDSGLWCTGAAADPPAAWVDGFSREIGIRLERVGDRILCPHRDPVRVLMGFEDGPGLAVCGPCGRKAGGVHKQLRAHYVGPKRKHPVTVCVLHPDGSTAPVEREQLARFRAGLVDEAVLAAEGAAAWRASGTARWVLGEQAFPDADALVEALKPEPWERPVLRHLVRNGHVGTQASVAGVLSERQADLGDALKEHLDDGPAFLREHAGMALRDIVRAAHEESERRAALERLPRMSGLGPQGRWIDDLARARVGGGQPAAVSMLRRAVVEAPVPRTTCYAFVQAVGGAPDLESRFTADERAAAQPLVGPAREVLGAAGDAYQEALRRFLEVSGAGVDG
ncbi:MAG TPA: hypothetical protein VFH47_02030 [Candidatus Thermoplasmatota archaeon]|nr:hypothetical protein [Candidatus Thermoplasmatota archaeon]